LPFVRATVFRRRRLETPVQLYPQLRSALFAGNRAQRSASPHPYRFPLRLPYLRAPIRVGVADAGRRRYPRRLWTPVRRYLSADAPASPLGSAEFPEGRSAGASLAAHAAAEYRSRARCAPSPVRRAAEPQIAV